MSANCLRDGWSAGPLLLALLTACSGGKSAIDRDGGDADLAPADAGGSTDGAGDAGDAGVVDSGDDRSIDVLVITDASNDGAADATTGHSDGVDGGDADPGHPPDSVVWNIDNLQSIGGHATTVVGAPLVIETAAGRAVQFDGIDDGLFIEHHPLAGFSQFTVEVVFRPDAGGAPEQRFFHMQATGSQNRVLFETRLPANGTWFLDTYVLSGGGGAPLLAEMFPHPTDRWYHAALVVDGTRMRHYVDGVEEMAVALTFQPHLPGRTSLGVRINSVDWYKGAIRLARFTPRALSPAQLLREN